MRDKQKPIRTPMGMGILYYRRRNRLEIDWCDFQKMKLIFKVDDAIGDRRKEGGRWVN